MVLPRIILPFLSGIALSLFSGGSIPLWVWLILLFSLVSILGLAHLRQAHYRYRWIFGAGITMGVFLLGMLHSQLSLMIHHPHYFGRGGAMGDVFLVKCTSAPIPKTASIQLDVTVIGVVHKEKILPARGKMILYLGLGETHPPPDFGAYFVVKCNPSEIPHSDNPTRFDYRRFLFIRNTYHTAYVRPDNFIKLPGEKGFSVVGFAMQFRSRLWEILLDSGINQRALQLVSALVLGMREGLDEELRQGFANAGAVHILCVSGLHVGIIYLVLIRIMGIFRRMPFYRITMAILLPGIIFIYAAITGFSVSVMRASVMFAIMILTRVLGRKTHTLQSLSLSAFVLLLYNPGYLGYTGFQLSYLAVLGIVLFQPYFAKHCRSWPGGLRQAGELMGVSLAAQMATAPVVMHAFGTFPNYFLFANLIGVPMATIVLYAALAALSFHGIPVISLLLFRVLEFAIWMLAESMIMIQSLPGSSTQGIWLTFTELCLLYVILIALYLLLIARRSMAMFLLLVSGMLLSFSIMSRSIGNAHYTSLVVFKERESNRIAFVHGRQSGSLICGNVNDEIPYGPGVSRDYFHARGITSRDVILCCDTSIYTGKYGLIRKQMLVSFKSIRLMWLCDHTKGHENSLYQNMEVFDSSFWNPDMPVTRLLVISGNVSPLWALYLPYIKPDKVIAARGLPVQERMHWANHCRMHNILFHDTERSGAFILQPESEYSQQRSYKKGNQHR